MHFVFIFRKYFEILSLRQWSILRLWHSPARPLLVITPYIWVNVMEGCCIYVSDLFLQYFGSVGQHTNLLYSLFTWIFTFFCRHYGFHGQHCGFWGKKNQNLRLHISFQMSSNWLPRDSPVALSCILFFPKFPPEKPHSREGQTSKTSQLRG